MKVFVAAPFTDKINGQDGRVVSEFKQELSSLHQYLRDHGYTVISAHEREEWGGSLMPPEICTPLDFDEIEGCDLLVAIPGHPISGGVHIEIGYATAKEKPIIQILKEKGTYSPLIHGLHAKTRTIYLYFRHSVTEVLPGLHEALSSLGAPAYSGI